MPPPAEWAVVWWIQKTQWVLIVGALAIGLCLALIIFCIWAIADIREDIRTRIPETRALSLQSGVQDKELEALKMKADMAEARVIVLEKAVAKLEAADN